MQIRSAILVAIPVILLGTLPVLIGGPADESNRVQALGPNEIVKVNLTETLSVQTLAPADGFEVFGRTEDARSFHPDALFLETMISYGNTTDPRSIFALVNAYLNANQQEIGIAFFQRVLARYEDSFTEETQAHYLAAYAILRATYADRVPLLSRIGWVTDTFELLDTANRLSGDADPLVKWASGLIYAQVPFFFFKQEAALDTLTWLAERPELEPISGFYREVYYHLSRLHAAEGNNPAAARFLDLSGYGNDRPDSLFMGWFTSTDHGATMQAAPYVQEILPERVYGLFGFSFSESYVVVSHDRKRAFLIDVLARPDHLARALAALSEKHPDLPPITDVFVTHAHWDHIGGVSYLRSVLPDAIVHGRENFHTVVERVDRNHSYDHFRGAGFQSAWVTGYTPDAPVHGRDSLMIGGTAIHLIPIAGGETEDALLIHFPILDTVFVGDFLMPYYGEPWVEEGNLEAASQAMELVERLDASQVLHGHFPLNFLYTTPKIKTFRQAFDWLIDTVSEHVENGYSLAEILRLNLIPPGLLEKPEAHLSFLSPRDHIIARTTDRMVGIWQEETTGTHPLGLTSLTLHEQGKMLHTYLGLSEGAVRNGIEAMLEAGDNALALQTAQSAELLYGPSAPLADLKEIAADRLRAAAQLFDPFEMITYTEAVGRSHPPMGGSAQ